MIIKVTYQSINTQVANYYFNWFNDPAVNKYLYKTTPKSKESILDWLKSCEDSSAILYFSILVNGENIGHVGIKDVDKSTATGTVGIVIGKPSLWGIGIGKQALNYIEKIASKESLVTLRALINTENERSIRLFRSMGYLINKNEDKFQDEYCFVKDLK